MIPALSFRSLAAAILLLLLALTAFAGNGCRKQAADLQSVELALPAELSSVVAVVTSAAVAETLFVFCHPEFDTAGLSAAASLVAQDTQATNDDRTEMMAWQPSSESCLQLLHSVSSLERLECPTPWVRDLLRPPRALGA